ncbi:MAG: fatty acid desaturase [Bacteroidetes bacterium]|nr:fatty acid desaturase [Bacteroidota bacterium]
MLKFKADVRVLVYFAIITAMFAGQWYYGFDVHSPLSWSAYIVYLHFAVSVAVITHNHNHINIWTNKTLNILTDWWLTVFYGLPIFVWIPTHNRNHHRYNNKEGDVTRTYRHTEDNDLTSLLMYPTISGKNQMKESIFPYMRELKEKNPAQYRENWMQLAVLIIWMIVFFIWNWKKALLFVFIPQQVSQITVIVFNYVQHVHADEMSEWNHSRNFAWVNPFLFNNGYHTIHHYRASLHWSQAPEEHAKIAHLISPDLYETSFWGYLGKTYILSLFMPKYKSQSMRLERKAREADEAKAA